MPPANTGAKLLRDTSGLAPGWFIIMSKKQFTLGQAKTIGEQLGIRWDNFDVAQFRAGLGVELEHGT